MSLKWEEVDVGEEQEWLDRLKLERSVFDNSGRRLWSGWIQHSIVAGGRKEIGLKSLRCLKWISQEILDAVIITKSLRPGVSTGR
eukprot:873047-Rhodomonas_salina.1